MPITANIDQLELRCQSIWRLMMQGDFQRAASQSGEFTRQFPHYPAGWYIASELAMRLSDPLGAVENINRAIGVEPDNQVWRLHKARYLLALKQPAKALEVTDEVKLDRLATAASCDNLASLLVELRRYEQALDAYEKCVDLEPDNSAHHHNRGNMQSYLGELQAADNSFGESIRLNHMNCGSQLMRSHLRRQNAEANHISELEDLLNKIAEPPIGRVQLLYALAKEYEDLGKYEESFDRLEAGASLAREHISYDIRQDEKLFDSIAREFSAERLKSAGTGDPSAEPIFVVGMPRTGTTLIERILASHSLVQGAGELNNFFEWMTALARTPGQAMNQDELVAATASVDFGRLGREYVASTRPWTGSTPHFVDKLPTNFLHLGPIHLALPNARIIHLTRHPMDTCYANLKQLFDGTYPFSYQQSELARFFVGYRKLMSHWHQVLPGAVYELSYEALVADPEAQIRQLLEFLDLPMQDACLDFHQNRSAVPPCSATQVRQPVYSSSVGLWQNYRQQLQPMLKVLQAANIDL
jgi:tetratricopeptide (TPR) repeat protein